MSENPQSRWRWLRFRFSLRTAFVLLTIGSVWLGWTVYQIQKREVIRTYIIAQGAVVMDGQPTKPWKKLPLSWSLFGVQPVTTIHMPLTIPLTAVDQDQLAEYFPEADVISPGGGVGGMGMF